MAKKKSKNKKTRSGRRPNPNLIHTKIRELFDSTPGKPYSIKQIIKKTGLRDKPTKEEALRFVFQLEDEGFLVQLRNGTFKTKKEATYHRGTVDHVNRRFAFIVSDELDEDVWVKTEDLKSALDGDEVSFQVIARKKSGRKLEGRVDQVIRRNRTEFVGRVEIQPNYAFVVPDNRKIHTDIFVHTGKLAKAKHNDKVIVKIKEWHTPTMKSPIGEVMEILGKAGENEAEIHSIMAEFGLPFRFTPKVEKAAEKIPETIPDKEIASRKDMRGVTTFTIDPVDAKDFDDAISLEKLDNGNFRIGVHIADVSHYVQSESILDVEAIDRATSVYLVDRTIPMLPEKLSNGVCSLRPKEDKLTFSAVFEMTSGAIVKKKWFGRTVTHSDRRFTYEEAQERIESKEGDFADEILLLNNLAKQLKKKRFSKGAINFETVEVKFQLDEKGKPLGVVPKERKDAHKLVEEFMLLANQSVAEYIYNKHEGKDTFVYRTHDAPDPEKLSSFSVFAQKFGHQLNFGKTNISNALNGLMEEIQGKPEQNVLESIAIRSMAKAKYTTSPDGHFGLAFPHYTHFTSPIRRYPDVMVHRLLDHYLSKGKSPEPEEFEDLCKHASDMEKRAADAERASIKYKQVEYMESLEKKDFNGIVSGVTEWGVYVEIVETKCEGMVRISDLEDDFYEYDEKNFCLVGKQNKRMITLGDEVKVQVVKTDIDRRTIDLQFVK